MKESIVSAVIIAMVVVMCIYTTNFTSTFCEEIKIPVLRCMDAAQKDDWDSAANYINEVKRVFDEKDSKLETFIMHQDLSEVHNVILKIDAAVKLKSLEVCISEANCLIGQLDRISSSDSLTVANIL